ncbi:twin-arginine translocation signal domain-containing protein [Halobacterium sp. R2-5]|uniref:twin-arginine translocation signal domain-containing protein n=1 Tax=Halobacterium sp. R2-5 TaxID=2715751 RepID=UPI00142185B4|nr:twin-arginine translocation signal domain-containing protein [Halobacterium sp. R2-5]NIB98554.1 twin-arginine translocation signal domain-containing protein [Halobacterium sp. R2-5]
MAKRHTERNDAQDDPNTDNAANDEATDGEHSVNRRTFVKALGAATAVGGTANLVGNARAVSDLSSATSPDGEVTLDPGEYAWGGGLDIGSGDALIGGGEKGDVVLNLESGTMDGSIEGSLENIVVRGSNPEAKSGINLYPGATVDGFVWPEGGQQSEDRALYTPDGGNDRLTLRNSAWGRMVNNGAYLDKPPVTIENCAAVNNNIANIRVGHRDGTDESETTYIRNSLVAVTGDISSDSTNSPHARGIRLRHPAHLVIENCWIVFFDVDGTADLIELHDGAAGSTVEIRNCAFYNDSDGDLVRDKSGGQMDVTIEDCVVAGSGSRNIEPDYSGNGVVEDDSVDYPLPSEVTGYAAADEIEGFDPNVNPWDGSTATTTNEDTLVLHSSPDNTTAANVSFTVAGSLAFAGEAEPDTDTIVDNGDGTMTATSVDLSPDELDSYRYTGDVVDYDVPEDFGLDVSVNGTTTTFRELLTLSEDNADVLEVVARQSGGLNYEFVVDGTAELHETSDTVSAGNGDSVTDNGDGTVTVTGFTGNDGYGDAYLVDGQIQSFSWDVQDYDFDVILNGEVVDPASFEETTDDATTKDSTTDDSTTDDSTTTDSTTDDSTTEDSTTDDSTDSGTETPHVLTVDGEANDVTAYTFTVSGDVVRDPELSEEGANDTNWAILEDFARDGKVIGLVGSGVDAYRFGGEITEITVDGDAAVSIDRNA